MWQIYSIGDSAFLTQILNAIAMLTGTGDFNTLVKIGLLLGVLIIAFQALFQGGKAIEFQHAFVAWLLFALSFGPSTRVVIEDAYTAQVRVVDNVPIGVAATGSIISRVGFQLTKLFEQGFSTSAMTDYGFASSLEALSQVRSQLQNRSGLGQSNSVGQSDLTLSWLNYIKECTLIGIDIGQKSMEDVMSDPNVLNAVKFDSRIYGTQILLSGKTENLDCSEAYGQLKLITETTFLPSLRNVLSATLGGQSETDTDAIIRASLNNLGLSTVSTQSFMATAVLLPIYEQAVSGKYLDEQAFTAAAMVNQAILQRNTQWAAEQTLFQSFVRPMMTFFEGFVYAITPIMGFVMALGQMGVRMVGKYLLILLWIQLWMPLLAIINLYIHMSIQGKMAALERHAGIEISSFTGLQHLDSILQTWIATGGMLASSIPAISLMIVYGSSITATHLAGRLQSGDTIDEKMMTPDIAKTAPVLQAQPLFQTTELSGTTMTGANNLMSNFSVGNTVSSMASSARETAHQATQQFSSQLGQSISRSLGETVSYDSLASLGQSMNATNSTSSDMVNRITDDFQQRYGFGDDKKDAVRGLVTGVLSGGVNVGVEKISTASGKGMQPSKGLISNLLGGSEGTTNKYANIQGGANLKGQVESSSASGKSLSSDTFTSELISLGNSDSQKADFAQAITQEFANSQRSGLSRSLSESEQSSLQQAAQDVYSTSERYNQLEQSNYQIAGQKSSDGATVTRLAANNPAVMDELNRYLTNHPEAAARLRAQLPMYKKILSDDNQAYVAAAMEALSYSNSSSTSERDNDKQAALNLMGMATQTPLNPVQPNRNSQLSDVNLGNATREVRTGSQPLNDSSLNRKIESQRQTFSTEQDAGPENIQRHHDKGLSDVTNNQHIYGQALGAHQQNLWKEQILSQNDGVNNAEMFFNSMNSIGRASAKYTDGAIHAISHLGTDYETYAAQAKSDPSQRGFMHNSVVASQATWEGLKASVTAGSNFENPLKAFKENYTGSSDQLAKELNWGTKVESIMAGAYGAAVNNRFGDYLDTYAETFKQEAYKEGLEMGLTPLQSQVFAQSFSEGLYGRAFNYDNPETWSTEMQKIRSSMLDEYPNDPAQRQLIDKQIGIIANASLAGEYAKNNLISLRALNKY